MCKTKRATLASEPRPRSRTSSAARTASSSAFAPTSSSGAEFPTRSSNRGRQSPLPAAVGGFSSSSTTSSSAASLASIRDSLPEPPALYSFSEICSATNNFLSKRLDSSSAWRCTLRGKDAVVFQRHFRGGDPAAVPARLAALGKSHHSSLIRLLGAALAVDHIYLAYEYTAGASLVECLRSPLNPNFTPLSSWASRVQVADDLAQGLQYIHRHSSVAGGVHNRIKSSAVIITEPEFRAKICHFGAADLAGEITPDADADDGEANAKLAAVNRSGSQWTQIEGTRAYMAPEVLAGRSTSRRSDVYALGVLLLELLAGDEPLKYRFDRQRKEYERVSLIETARAAIGTAAMEEESATAEAGVRRWVDRRLKDSFHVPAAEKLIRVALRCVEEEAAARPTMDWVAGKVSMIYLESMTWAKTIGVPTDISVSIAPR